VDRSRLSDYYDVVVVGGGAGGLGAAQAAARRGASVLLVQEGRLGGDCTFTGCVPSKALIAAAARGTAFADAIAQVHRAVETVAATEDDEALRRQGVDVLHGWARFTSPTEIDVAGRRLRSPRFVIATGAAPLVPPVEGLQGAHPLTNENVFDLDQLPRRLAVMGGGPIGAELAQAFARFGTEVTVLESGDRLLPKEEPEASRVIEQAFVDEGVDVRKGARVTRVERAGSEGSRLTSDDGRSVEADRVLVAVGRRPSTSDLGLEEIGVVLDDQGHVQTDGSLATSVEGVWAVGDVTGKLQFTHAANQMALVAVRNALSPWSKLRRRRFDPSTVPWVTFTSPEVGRVGMTEAEAVDHGGRVAYLPMSELDRAVAVGETRGFVKLIAGPRALLRDTAGGRLLGATTVASVGGELVHEVALAMQTNAFTGRLAQTVHAYPTWSMAVQQAAAQFFFEIGGREARPAQR